MKVKLLPLTLFLASTVLLSAQETIVFIPDSISNSITAHINTQGKIRIIQPAKLQSIVDYKTTDVFAYEEKGSKNQQNPHGRAGYRILVFDDNNPRTAAAQAKNRERQIAEFFPQYNTYVSFNSPYWRVKAGDFRTRAEAEDALKEIREAFPQFSAFLRIVRDKINTTN